MSDAIPVLQQVTDAQALIECEACQWFVSGTDQTTYSKDVEL